MYILYPLPPTVFASYSYTEYVLLPTTHAHAHTCTKIGNILSFLCLARSLLTSRGRPTCMVLMLLLLSACHATGVSPLFKHILSECTRWHFPSHRRLSPATRRPYHSPDVTENFSYFILLPIHSLLGNTVLAVHIGRAVNQNLDTHLPPTAFRLPASNLKISYRLHLVRLAPCSDNNAT